jgi:hypothetical protein
MEAQSIEEHENAEPSLPPSREKHFAFVLGFLAAVVSVVVVFLGFRVGFPNMKEALFPSRRYEKDSIRIPPDVLELLKAQESVVGNAGNPTGTKPHDTILVQPDAELTYRLRPGAVIYGAFLRTVQSSNFNPPLLFNIKPKVELPLGLQAFMDREVRVAFTYTVDKEGFRTTLPVTASETEILIVGDSVTFGTGVNDVDTMASCLQEITGPSVRVVNGGVGGYDSAQSVQYADYLARDRSFSALVYVACQNDFMLADDWNAEARMVLAKLKNTAARFQGNVLVVLHTYLEYVLSDIFLKDGWGEKTIARTHELRKTMKESCQNYGFFFHDWTDIAEKTTESGGSLFSRFALYVDHCHLSRLGNIEMARVVLAEFQAKGIVKR